MTSATLAQTPIAFDTHHDDVIHDAKVDFYGRRLATASSDRTVRVFQINANQTETLLSILSGHEGPVWQIAWAHPKFGSILASCSYDGTVIIWQEDAADKTERKNSSKPGQNGTSKTWSKLKVHRAHDVSVNSIAFSPHQHGLNLACAGADGKISILSRAEDGSWQSVAFMAHQSGCNAVAWCPSSLPASLFALNFNAHAQYESGPMRLASGGCDNVVKIWCKVVEEPSAAGGEDEYNSWRVESSLTGHTDWVRDVCWRPNLGQADHVLVSCGQDCNALIWREHGGEWSKRLLKSEPFPDTLWRVSFAEYGGLLAVTCGDNTVSLWREVPETGEYVRVGVVDEGVTETIKISEPLAVEPPEPAPLPKVQFSATTASAPTSPKGAILSVVDEGVAFVPEATRPDLSPDVSMFIPPSYEAPTYQVPSPQVAVAEDPSASAAVGDVQPVYGNFEAHPDSPYQQYAQDPTESSQPEEYTSTGYYEQPSLIQTSAYTSEYQPYYEGYSNQDGYAYDEGSAANYYTPPQQYSEYTADTPATEPEYQEEHGAPVPAWPAEGQYSENSPAGQFDI